MIDANVIAFALAAALLTIAPGQDTTLVVRNVLRGGRRDGIVTTFGICAGLFVHATLSALGVSAVASSPAGFHLLKIAGGCYLVSLGARSLVAAVRSTRQSETTEVRPTTAGAGRSFAEGLLSNLLNPKTALFYLAFLPQFIGPTDAVLPTSLLLASVHWVESIAWLSLVSATVDRTRRLFLSPTVRRSLEGVCGALLVGLGVRLAFARP